MPDIVTVARYETPWEAHVARGLLESEGVPATIADEHLVGANFALSYAVGGVKLKVSTDDLVRARAVLADLQRGVYEDALAEELGEAVDACPQCGSRRFEDVRAWSDIALVVLLCGFFEALFPARRAARRCRDCGGRVPEAANRP
jgi:DNA-directed RNA polymerase subunit RPC12/RpoP